MAEEKKSQEKKTSTKKTQTKTQTKTKKIEDPKPLMLKVMEIRNELSVKKDAKNPHKQYNYFSPDGINNALNPLLLKYKIYDHFNFIYSPERDKYVGKYTLYNLEVQGDVLVYEFDIPLANIAGANPAQNGGGTLTYGKRYSQMNAFNIADPESDLDHPKQSGEKTSKSSSSSRKKFTKSKTQPKTKTSGSSGSKSTSKSKTKDKKSEDTAKTETKDKKESTKSKEKSEKKDDNAPSKPQQKYLEVLQKKGKIPEDVDIYSLSKDEASQTIDEVKKNKELTILKDSPLPDVDEEENDVDDLVDDE